MGKIIVLLTPQDMNALENTMNMQIQDDNGFVLHKMTEASTKQQWYREVIRAGLKTKIKEFEREKQRLEEGEEYED